MSEAPKPFRQMVRRALRHLVSLVFYYSGCCTLFQRVRRMLRGGTITILAYHGVNDGPFALNLFITPTSFEAQMRFLQRHYAVVPLSQVEALLREGRSLDRDVIVLTFDDGYRDNFDFAFPILSGLRLPATVYLATDPIDKDFPTFIYALVLAIHGTRTAILNLSQYGLGVYDLTRQRTREIAIAEIDRYAKRVTSGERRALLDHILTCLGVSSADPLFRGRMLTWDLVRHMRRCGISFGAHTVTHPVLAQLSAAEIHQEITESKRIIEEQLAEEVTSFAYPYGGTTDVSSTVCEIVEKCGFTSGVVLYEGDTRHSSLFTVPRKMVAEETSSGILGRFSTAVFACEVSGLFDILLRRGARGVRPCTRDSFR